MKGRSIGYLTREGFRNIWVNRMLSLATVVVLVSCLLIVGSGMLIYFNINSVLETIEGENVVMVYVEDAEDELSRGQYRVQLEDALKKTPNVKKTEYIPYEEAFDRQMAQFGDKAKVLSGLDKSILPDAIKVTVKDLKEFDATVNTIRGLPHVLDIQNNSELAGKLASLRNAVTYVSAGIVLILFFVSLFIVSNTIRITIYNRRLEISIMKAVGATNAFIRWPFIVEGILLGLFSAVLGLGLEYGMYSLASIWLGKMMSTFGGEVVDFVKYIWIILGVYAFIGVIIGTFGSIASLNKYLKEHHNVVEND